VFFILAGNPSFDSSGQAVKSRQIRRKRERKNCSLTFEGDRDLIGVLLYRWNKA
jgi:hypothetical protein